MLKTEQKVAIERGFEVGFSDTRIARSVPNVNHMQVFNYRRKLKIETKTIVNRRYDIWTKMIYNGVSISRIAGMYGVTEQSIKVLLWKNRQISLVEAKARVIKLREKNQLSDIGEGIPKLTDLGMTFPPIVPQGGEK